MRDDSFEKLIDLLRFYITGSKEDFEKKLKEYHIDADMLDEHASDAYKPLFSAHFDSVFKGQPNPPPKIFGFEYTRGPDGELRVTPIDTARDDISRLFEDINLFFGKTLENFFDLSSHPAPPVPPLPARIMWDVIYDTKNRADNDYFKFILEAPAQNPASVPDLCFDNEFFSITINPHLAKPHSQKIVRPIRSAFNFNPFEFDLDNPSVTYNNGVFEYTFERFPPRI
ncbi:hypothetical protein COT72_00940 [archaeon CG10_big_fil_rev_8_21_14_0_10_43_11]|nr:MAG: hypothetical protein COT72_00940 [archaeon CG10_big_fil_rev_8_21_14_0_10_43_11]